MMSDRYMFPAVFYPPEDKGLDFCVVFPDLDVATQGENLQDAMEMAKELLELVLYGLECEGVNIPKSSNLSEIVIDSPGAFVTMISVHKVLVCSELDDNTVEKTVTLPKWLNDMAEEADINFSRSLQSFLRFKLGLSEPTIEINEDRRIS